MENSAHLTNYNYNDREQHDLADDNYHRTDRRRKHRTARNYDHSLYNRYRCADVHLCTADTVCNSCTDTHAAADLTVK